MVRYYRDLNSGATASITIHRDGTATLSVSVGGKRERRKYKNFKSAYATWYRWTN